MGGNSAFRLYPIITPLNLNHHCSLPDIKTILNTAAEPKVHFFGLQQGLYKHKAAFKGLPRTLKTRSNSHNRPISAVAYSHFRYIVTDPLTSTETCLNVARSDLLPASEMVTSEEALALSSLTQNLARLNEFYEGLETVEGRRGLPLR